MEHLHVNTFCLEKNNVTNISVEGENLHEISAYVFYKQASDSLILEI